MSKKKASGNTMTLKDFHGGSIPTDLPLPSAPGVTGRTSDRSVYDRPSSWGNPMVRSDHRSRPQTSPATMHYDDKTPFLTHAAQIGRNFDEDERKPLDGISAPRRTVSDDSVRAPPSRVEMKPESGVGRSSLSRQVAPVSQNSFGTVNSYSARLTEAIHVRGSSQHVGGGSQEQGTGGVYPNVWAMRKEVASAVEPEHSAWSSPNAVSKLAHASAIDKVSSGRWQSKTVHHQTDVEVVKSSEVESASYGNVTSNNAYGRVDDLGEKVYNDVILARQAEKGLVIGDQMQGGRNELLDYERSGASKYSEGRPRGIAHHTDVVQQDGKLCGSEFQHSVPSEPTERPKLKLIPRSGTKPLDNPESPVYDYLQGSGRISDAGHVETVHQVHAHANLMKPVSTFNEVGKEVGQRPKLNLKPRSQPLDQLEGNVDRERNALFGGARPRELVLKERGIDNVAIKDYDVAEHSNRVEYNIGRAENVPDRSTHVEKTQNTLHDQRAIKRPEKKEQRVEAERGNGQRRNWRGDNRRNMRETERQQVSERQPSPETWRKPVEESKSSSDMGMRHNKAASAVELAQAFSRSISDPKADDRFSSQRGLNGGRARIPFSRLVGPPARPQINGY
ncbi:uncharacterized protein LOC114750045 isoform X1 [Neltuma alba]|uniref:uncharacterized protein LOC114750045 isoform X1 n=1 Tax=Neltuma alba TaxID=207710 RepID=UPI0010A44732|nr:uncharacterized protein LOC114750045 isoform X1 [Prosopis alba]